MEQVHKHSGKSSESFLNRRIITEIEDSSINLIYLSNEISI